MGGRKVVLAVVAVSITALLISLNLPSLANAQPQGVPARSPQPTTEHQYGVPIASIVNVPTSDFRGGWSPGRTFSSTGSSISSTKPFRTVAVELQEPFYYGSLPTDTGTKGLRFGAVEYVGAEVNGDTERSQYSIGGTHSTLGGSFAYCSSTEWSLPSAQTKRAGAAVMVEHGGSGGTQIRVMSTNFVTASNCPFVVKLSVVVTAYGGENASSIFTWSANRWYLEFEYNDDQTALDLYCQSLKLDQYDPKCNDRPVSTWAMCNGAPQPKWLDFSWLPRFVVHYAVCLAIPRDPLAEVDQVRDAWQASAFRDLVEVKLPAVGEAFRWQESCGVLFDFNPQLDWLPRVQLNTCSWSTVITPAFRLGFNITMWAVAGITFVFIVVRLLLWTFKQEGVMK